MGYRYLSSEVINNEEILKNIFVIKVKGSFSASPGQFFMLRGWKEEPLLGRPISIYDIDNEGISFLYQVVGRGTEILKGIKSGEKLELLGPLGNGFPLDNIKGRIGIVAGGIGIAPMAYLINKIKASSVDVFAGFRDYSFGLSNIENKVNKIYISTESGREGIKGYVTELIDVKKYDMILCCGPEIMMDIMVKRCKEAALPIYVSMEKRMACGIGACLVCTCKTKLGNKRSCKDGPVFLGEELV
jgi:dihydroorotate dehydrogenase electron transfer subunit